MKTLELSHPVFAMHYVLVAIEGLFKNEITRIGRLPVDCELQFIFWLTVNILKFFSIPVILLNF